jgi:hypothetical protein
MKFNAEKKLNELTSLLLLTVKGQPSEPLMSQLKLIHSLTPYFGKAVIGFIFTSAPEILKWPVVILSTSCTVYICKRCGTVYAVLKYGNLLLYDRFSKPQ